MLNLSFYANDIPDDADVSIRPEDVMKAQDIGVLTPRRPPSTEIIDEGDFDLFIDDHENMLDELADLLQEDMDGISGVNNREESIPDITTTIVRVTHHKKGFSLGSIGGQPTSVYIPYELCHDCQIHSFYLMQLLHTPWERNQWRATYIYPKNDTNLMLTADGGAYEKCRCIRQSSQVIQSHQFTIPISPQYIGVMIGKDGRNIDSLVSSFSYPESSPPDITITPFGNDKCFVSVLSNSEYWSLQQICGIVSHMHC